MMQAIDVLRNDLRNAIQCLQLRERIVRSIRTRFRDEGPANHASTPIALAPVLAVQKLVETDGRRARPAAVDVAVARNARVGARAGAGQCEKARMSTREMRERVDVGKRHVRSSYPEDAYLRLPW